MNSMLELYGYLLRKHCFSHSELEQLIGDTKKTDNVIYQLKKQGLIFSVRKNLYVAVNLSDKSSAAERFEIASHVTESSCISHHSAFEFYGLANQIYYEIYVSSKTKFNDFDFEGNNYKFIKSDNEFGITEIKHVRITDIERTVIESIKDFEKIGGLEETIRCIELVKSVSEAKLEEYLNYYNNQFLFQKTGFILQKFSTLNLTDSFFKFCKENSKKSIRYLNGRDGNSEYFFDKEWNICIPKSINNLLEEGEIGNV